jgi:FKBP-type peptidyl-prolyl cis-trans isomerase
MEDHYEQTHTTTTTSRPVNQYDTHMHTQPFTFQVGLGQVIKGWDESVIGMSVGELARIHCTPDYAYGSGGFPDWGILPKSELIFEIEILSFKP